MEDSGEAITSGLSAVPMETFSGCSSGSTQEPGCGFFFEVAVERCPLCQRVRMPMFCATCVRQGNFGTGDPEAGPVRFSELHKRYLELLQDLKTNHERIDCLRNQNQSCSDTFRTKKTRLLFLRQLLSQKRALLEQRQLVLLQLRSQNRQLEEMISTVRAKRQRRQKRRAEERSRIVRRDRAAETAERLLRERRRECLLKLCRRVYSVDFKRPWTRVCGIQLPALTVENYHVLDSSDRTVASLLYAAFFLRALLLVLEIHLPRPLSTAMFGQDLVTRDDLVLLYRSLVYVVQRIFGHTEDNAKLDVAKPVLPQLVEVFRSANLGRVGPCLQHRLQWLPMASLDVDETSGGNAEWVEVPWDVPYDAASAESQMGATSANHTSRSFISSGAGLVSSFFGFAFGQTSHN